MRVFSCEFCEISKNTFLHKTPLVAASVYSSLYGRLYVNHAQNQHFWSFLIYIKAIVHQRFYERILLVNNYGSAIGKENLKSYVQYDGNNCFKGFKLFGFRLPVFFYICLNMLFLNILENVIDSIPLWSFFVKTLFVLIWHHYLSRFKNHTSSLTV